MRKRQCCRQPLCLLCRQSCEGADHRGDKLVEGEDRRGRETRQHDDRLAAGHGQAQRFFAPGSTRRHGRRCPGTLNDATARVARSRPAPFEVPARRESPYRTTAKPSSTRRTEHDLHRPGRCRANVGRRRPPRPRQRGSPRSNRRPHPGRIGVPGATISSPVEMMATRGRRHTSTAAQPTAASMPISREVSSWPARKRSLPRARSLPAKAMNWPGAAGRRTSMTVARSTLARLSVLDHDDGVGAARHHAARGDQSRPPRQDCDARLAAGRQYLGIQCEGHWCCRSLASAVSAARRANPSTLGTIEPGHIDIGDNRACQHAPQGLRQRHDLATERAQPEMAVEARRRFIAVDDV